MTGASLAQYAALQSHNLKVLSWKLRGDNAKLLCFPDNLPTMQETLVRSLVWEDPLEKGTASYSSILAWRIPWTEEPGDLQSLES